MRRRPARVIFLAACLASALLTTGGVEPKAARLNNRGNDRFEAKKFDEAAALYDQAQTRVPESPEIAYNHGNALYKQGRLEDAANQLRRAASSPDAALRRKSLYNLGNALHDLKKLPEAADAYRQALALDPRDRKAKINYEKTLQELEQQKKKQQQQQQQQQGQNKKQDQQQQGQQGQQGQQQQDQQQGDQRDESKPQDEEQGQQKEDGSRQDSQQEPGSAESQEENAQEAQQPQMAALDSVKAGDLSREEAIRILEAMREQERELQKERARKPVRTRRVEKDW